ncbi:MAG: hypothetical protein H7Z75_22160 [Ferruginibacter sp.]|nr:hypothetical protein [Cytophagales bacterium]
MKSIEMSLNTKMDDFMNLTAAELAERKRLIEEYIALVVTHVEDNPTEFIDNRLRRSEACSMRTLSEVFGHRIEELRETKHLKNVA